MKVPHKKKGTKKKRKNNKSKVSKDEELLKRQEQSRKDKERNFLNKDQTEVNKKCISIFEQVKLISQNPNHKDENWYYKDTFLIESNHTNGFIYLIYNVTKNLFYIGMKTWYQYELYCGSSKPLLRDICAGDKIVKLAIEICDNKLA